MTSNFVIKPSLGVAPPLRDADITPKIKERKLSYLNGLQLLIDRLALNSRQLTLLREWAKTQEYAVQQDEQYFQTSKQAKKNFYLFFNGLAKGFSSVAGISYEQAYDFIFYAELYAVWEKKRRQIKSSVLIREPRCENLEIVLMDDPIYSLTDDQRIEWLKIFEGKGPVWFQALPLWQRNYLRERLAEHLNEIVIPFLETMPGLRNPLTEYEKLFTKTPPLWFEQLPLEDQTRLKTALDHLFGCPPSTLRHVPGLANFGKHALMLNGQVVSEQIRFSIPTPIDVQDFKTNVYLTKQNILQLLEGTNSPLSEAVERFVRVWNVPADRDIELPLLLQTLVSPIAWTVNELTMFNILKEALIAFGTQRLQVRVGEATYHVVVRSVAPNHPVNFARRPVMSWLASIPSVGRNKKILRQKNIDEATLLLKNVGRFLRQIGLPADLINGLTNVSSILDYNIGNIDGFINSIPPDFSAQQREELTVLFNALKEYVVLYQRRPGRLERFKHAVDRGAHKEKFIISLEQIIVQKMGGIGSGSCKSGKDRKGLELLHTDAMLIYYRLYGSFPKYLDTQENREKFVTIFTGLFNTGHQQLCAAQNSPGVFALKGIQALKRIRTFLDPCPADILKRVFPTVEHWEKNDLLAGLNKPINVFKKGLLIRLIRFLARPFFEKEVPETVGQEQLRLLSQTVEGISESEPSLPVDSKELFARTVSTISAKSRVRVVWETPKPVQWVAPSAKTVEQVQVKAFYFPQGSHWIYQTNTVEIIGKAKTQIGLLPFYAMKYFVKNPDSPIVINGSDQVLEALQWIFVAGLDVSPEKIQLPYLAKSILITRDRKGVIQVPTKYKMLVSKARKLKREYDIDPKRFFAMEQQKETDTVSVHPTPQLRA
jgi:hypothetical protein